MSTIRLFATMCVFALMQTGNAQTIAANRAVQSRVDAPSRVASDTEVSPRNFRYTDACGDKMPAGSVKDLSRYVIKHSVLQEKLSVTLESFRDGEMSRKVASKLYSDYVREYNSIVDWADGRATGVCFTKGLLDESSKVTDATMQLMQAYREELAARRDANPSSNPAVESETGSDADRAIAVPVQ